MAQPREFHLTFEIPPPATVRPGLPFTIPVIISVRAIGTPPTQTVTSRNEPSMSGYAKFTGLMISQPGKYRLRIMLSTSSVNGVVTKEFVDSGVIHVQAAAPAAQRPSPATIATLQQLTVENLDISAADIARWQSA
ncbi:hypothetical protein N7539_006217 [Penicillium diatomitis]|uniref:Velvet domain-containing protein n=1 Tax=Penicillium diatomitis TaxID=2819901 RepID=A0A9X0BST8_9EURO|nr:uncharacterized protein N7539_006217 [Penicillium diatomitis]KAJ5482771.1 hypothetical protein N7539_006217 [Penicillium diatomitis]